MGATFFSLEDSHWPNFATIVTTDEHDMGQPSKLSRPGVFRLNIATRKETFQRLVGGTENPDYSALDVVLPHPVYAKELWGLSSEPHLADLRRAGQEAHRRLLRAPGSRLPAPLALHLTIQSAPRRLNRLLVRHQSTASGSPAAVNIAVIPQPR